MLDLSGLTITIIILAIAAIFFVTEITPVGVTSFSVSIALYLTGVLDVKTAFSGLVDQSVLLFAGMFVVAGSLFETGLADEIGQRIVRAFGRSETKLLMAVMVVAALLSVFLSNIAVTASLLPVVISIADSAGYSRAKFLLPLAIATALGGTISLVGTPPNVIADGYMRKAGLEGFGFMEFAWYGVPLTIAGIAYLLTFGRRFLPDRPLSQEEIEESAKRLHSVKYNGANKRNQYLAAIIFTLTILGMFFSSQIKVAIQVVAVTGALLLVFTRVITDKQAYRSIDWNTIFLTGGMMPMAVALEQTGAGKLIATGVLTAFGENPAPILVLAALFFISGTLTQFMSNVALAALLCPIALSIAQQMGVNPKAFVLAVSFAASSAFATPVGTPATAIVFGPGKYTFMDYVKIGTPVLILSFILCVIIMPLAWPF